MEDDKLKEMVEEVKELMVKDLPDDPHSWMTGFARGVQFGVDKATEVAKVAVRHSLDEFAARLGNARKA